uniref:CSON000948 protein n=1 Tax=Culicoides sonorensis TaxID=179676 RepID=A0A336KVR5_CULSO
MDKLNETTKLHEHSRSRKDDKTASAATPTADANPSTSGTKNKSQDQILTTLGDSHAEDTNKLSLGSVSSDSLSISYNKNDEDDDDEDQSEVLSNSLQSDRKKSSSMSREDSLENPIRDTKESIEEEIVEEIVEELIEGSANSEDKIPGAKQRKRTLFNLDDDEESMARDLAKKFGIDDSDISIGNIAQDISQPKPSNESDEPVLKIVESSNLKSDFRRSNSRDADSLEEAPNSLESSSSSKENVEPGATIQKPSRNPSKSEIVEKVKELSPLQEDVILINNNKVSLNILKQLQAASSQDNSLNNTTNDISDLAKDTFTQYSNAETSKSVIMPKETQSLREEIQTPDVSGRGFNSLGTAVPYKLPKNIENQDEPTSVSPSMSCGEEDKSIEEMIIENSIEISSKSCVIDDIVQHTDNIKQNIDFEFRENDDEEDDQPKSEMKEKSPDSPENLKEKILLNSATFAELQLQRQAEGSSNVIDESSPAKNNTSMDEQPVIKKMQRADTFTKEVLDDISEESRASSDHIGRSLPEETSSKLIEKGSMMRRILEQNITKRGEITNQTLSSDILEKTTSTINDTTMSSANQQEEAVNLDVMRTMEARIKDLQNIVSSKDICISALNSRLENLSRRGSWKEGRDSLPNVNLGSGKESSSFTSTIYKDVNEDAMADIIDVQAELMERDTLIDQLTERLQQSIADREQLQKQGETLTQEVEALKRQLADTLELIKKPPQFNQSFQQQGNQRLSQVSIDLVSDFDEDEGDTGVNPFDLELDMYNLSTAEFSQEIENFRQILKPEELKIFCLIQKKFDEFLRQELEKVQESHESELKILRDELESEKSRGQKVLCELRSELESKHTQEMEKLRTYFEQKCSDLEKQFSEDVFSQHSRRHSAADTGSDISDQENLPEEKVASKPSTPKHKSSLYFTSPTHRKITPTSLEAKGSKNSSPSKKTSFVVGRSLNKTDEPQITDLDAEMTLDELKLHYETKIEEARQHYEEIIEKLENRLKHQETRVAEHSELRTSDVVATTNQVEVEHEQKNTQEHEIPGATTFSTSTNISQWHEEEQQEFQAIVADFERRLKEQVQLAREDVIRELEEQFQALASDKAPKESDWPREFLLLREQFTAKSQLEITQLKIQHAEEMARIKSDYEWKLQQKLKRQNKFDSSRDLDKIINERDTLRELSSTLRWVLGELAKYFSVYENDLNATLFEELQRYADQALLETSTALEDQAQIEEIQENEINKTVINESVISTVSNTSKKFVKYAADMSGILSLIEEPSIMSLLSKKPGQDQEYDVNVEDCLEKLKKEACHLLGLSQQLCKYKDDEKMSDKSDSCEEEDGLKSSKKRSVAIAATKSLDDNAITVNQQRYARIEVPPTNSLPIFTSEDIASISFEPKSELNVKLHELKNRLLKSEDERRSLETELAETLSRHDSLAQELKDVKQQLVSLESNKEMISEGYGVNPMGQPIKSHATSLLELQERAKSFLTPSENSSTNNNSQLLQLIEDFCRESDRYFEEGKQGEDDLKLQIEAADKQLKATRKFLEEQAAEREHERDDFTKEIERLKAVIRDRDKERGVHERTEKEELYGELCISHEQVLAQVDQMKQQIESLQQEITEGEDKRSKLESDLKDSLNKIYDLREIITELENQIESRTTQEAIYCDRIKELEAYIDAQNTANDTLTNEVETLRLNMDEKAFLERITYLEGELKKLRPSGEQSIVLETISDNLRVIETTLDRKTKFLESLHADVCSASCSSPSEDISHQDSPIKKLDSLPLEPGSLPVDEVQRIIEKLAKHSRAEEAAVKRIKDLEMQIVSSRVTVSELQNERDILQERMSEQLARISSLQSRLDEQRLRAEELHRQGTSDLNIRVHDLQNEVTNLKETLIARDNQIKNLNTALENSKNAIERLEVELAIRPMNETAEHIQKLENNLRQQKEDNEALRDKIKNEMINKLAIPDLIETMLSDKNEEIDHLKEKLMAKERELQTYAHLFDKQNPSKNETGLDDQKSARTLSDIISLSEYDEPDVMRRQAQAQERSNDFAIPGASLHGFPMETSSKHFNSTQRTGTTTDTLFGPRASTSRKDNSTFARPEFYPNMSDYPKDANSVTPDMQPRHINFSLAEETASSVRLRRENLLGTPAIIEEITDEDLSQIAEEPQKEEIEELRKQAARVPILEKEIESLKLELDQFSVESKDKVDGIVNERKELQAEINDLRIKVSEMQKIEVELKYKSREIEDLNAKLRQFQTEMESRNEEIAILQDKSDSKAAECETLQLEIERMRKSDITKRLMFQIDTLTQQVDSLNKIISHKDELLSKLEKDATNHAKAERDNSSLEGDLHRMKNELHETKQKLTDKLISYEKMKIDLVEATKEIEILKQCIHQKDALIRNTSGGELSVISAQLQEAQNENLELKTELERLKCILGGGEHSQDSQDLQKQSDTLDARLTELKSLLDQEIQKCQNLMQIRDDLQSDFNELKRCYDIEKDNGMKLQMILDTERKQSNSMANQDANLIQALRIRLDAALDNEAALQEALEKERAKSDHLAGVQRTKSFDNYIMMRSPLESPKKFHRSSDFDSEAISRLESEIKMLTAQKERERERVIDMQNILERERQRFESDISERNEYIENMKREVTRISKDKEMLENELDHTQEKLMLSQREIESLEQRLVQMQELDSRRSVRRGKEIVESSKTATDLHGVKEKLKEVEKERDSLCETIARLKQDIERGAQREAKYAEALSQANLDCAVPEQFMEKLREMNRLLTENAKENRQLVETMQILSEERRDLQKRIIELEQDGANFYPRSDLEERANHLFGKYLRTESYRKALVHQKRYLLMVLAVYEENEAKAISMLGNEKKPPKRKPTFRGAVYVVIAIERMKYVVRRWHSGKRVATKAVFSQQFAPRRSQSASNNVWTTSHGDHIHYGLNPTSPPCRDRPCSNTTPNLSTIRSNRIHGENTASPIPNQLITEFTETVNISSN